MRRILIAFAVAAVLAVGLWAPRALAQSAFPYSGPNPGPDGTLVYGGPYVGPDGHPYSYVAAYPDPYGRAGSFGYPPPASYSSPSLVPSGSVVPQTMIIVVPCAPVGSGPSAGLPYC
jgi:hypothetical protein